MPNQIRIIRGPYAGRVHDVEPYNSGECAKLRPDEAAALLASGDAEPVRSVAVERAVAEPEPERAVTKRKATKPKKRPKRG